MDVSLLNEWDGTRRKLKLIWRITCPFQIAKLFKGFHWKRKICKIEFKTACEIVNINASKWQWWFCFTYSLSFASEHDIRYWFAKFWYLGQLQTQQRTLLGMEAEDVCPFRSFPNPVRSSALPPLPSLAPFWSHRKAGVGRPNPCTSQWWKMHLAAFPPQELQSPDFGPSPQLHLSIWGCDFFCVIWYERRSVMGVMQWALAPGYAPPSDISARSVTDLGRAKLSWAGTHPRSTCEIPVIPAVTLHGYFANIHPSCIQRCS